MHSETCNIRDNLTGELCYKKSIKKLIVVCHGYQSSSAHPALVAITRGLNNKGYTSFTFNFSGKNQMDIAQQVRDIHDICFYFAAKYSEIILLAGSMGALNAAIASRHEKVSSLITINGFFGSTQLDRKHKTTFLVFRALALASPRYKKIWNFYKREFKPERIRVPVLVIHSKVDEIVSIAQSKSFFSKLICPKQFTILDRADHHITSTEYRNRIVQAIDAWLTAI